jgi:hypothetical protein
MIQYCYSQLTHLNSHHLHSIEMATNTYVVEYAKTGRASCKNKPCKKKTIEKDSVRVGKVSPNPFSEGDTKTEYLPLTTVA